MAETKEQVIAERDALKDQLAALDSNEPGSADDRTIFQRILDIASEVGVLELARSANGGVPFAYRGIDATVAKLSPLLIKHGVFIVPVGVEQLVTQREVGSKVLTKTEVIANYRFVGQKGDYIDAQVPAQADDFADRSSAQAMSVAFRILLLQTFHIPAFGDEEAASQDTMNARDTAASAKVDKARAATAPKTGPSDPAEQMRRAIVDAATKKGWDGDKINKFAREVTGKEDDASWFNDPDSLNLILSKING